ncbi:hypothetical protein SARC_05932 [Sphaeroforma arctica JP610]|uniref:Uncharacterized protein n=1 Tax=Sphaeroforma arctica JP610 TaxID=667725 RepID=A0A0L0G0M8_9EUKA|nr:hypothetical protein SARC_05932 [Sphaeroforma arctica JP610]KNC81763.1 hypothetical protein SARC_05932 [Sphaeroforma arctica JP610]|eukprot:XP_014155665.1 hypothetical protein SARC_05932 [Sphaeroforma arctica JP610]
MKDVRSIAKDMRCDTLRGPTGVGSEGGPAAIESGEMDLDPRSDESDGEDGADEASGAKIDSQMQRNGTIFSPYRLHDSKIGWVASTVDTQSREDQSKRQKEEKNAWRD